jgi:cytochrome c-type biogenesis protein CcmF
VEALQDRQLTVGEPYFVRLAVPIGIALLFLMAVGPVLPWRKASGELLRQRLLVPAWTGTITLVVALLAGARGIANVFAFALGAFTLASIARSVVIGVRSRRRVTKEPVPTATVRAVRSNPRLYGGLLVHVGVVVIAVALAASAANLTKREVQLSEGETARVAGFTLTLEERVLERAAQKTSVKARVLVDGVGVMEPAISTFPNAAQGIGTPAIHTTPWRDVYLTLVSSPTSGAMTIGVQTTNLVMWLWIGGLLMAIGTAIALVPARKRDVLARTEIELSHDDEEPAPLAEANR